MGRRHREGPASSVSFSRNVCGTRRTRVGGYCAVPQTSTVHCERWPLSAGFSSSRRQQDLFRVLKAYTLYRPEEGYCQAQAPIAAVLLMHMPAEVPVQPPGAFFSPTFLVSRKGRSPASDRCVVLHLILTVKPLRIAVSSRACFFWHDALCIVFTGCLLGAGPNMWEVPSWLLQSWPGGFRLGRSSVVEIHLYFGTKLL